MSNSEIEDKLAYETSEELREDMDFIAEQRQQERWAELNGDRQ